MKQFLLLTVVLFAGCGESVPAKPFADAYLEYTKALKELESTKRNGRDSFFLIDECERKMTIYSDDIKKADEKNYLKEDEIDVIIKLKGPLELAERVHAKAEEEPNVHPIQIEKIINDLDRKWAVLEAAAEREGRTEDLPDRHFMGPEYARLYKEDVITYRKKLDELSKRLKPAINFAERKRFL